VTTTEEPKLSRFLERRQLSHYQRRRQRLLRAAVRKAGCWRCHLCGLILLPEKATLDHVIPDSEGGKYSSENLRLACKKCNNERRTEPVHLYKMRKLLETMFPCVAGRRRERIANFTGFHWAGQKNE